MAVLLTFHFICFTFIFFRNVSFDKSILMIDQMLFNMHWELLPEVIAGYTYVMLLIIAGYTLHFIPKTWKEKPALAVLQKGGLVAQGLLLVLVIYLVIQTKSSSIQPFIYFQF